MTAEQLFQSFNNLNILIIGDVMIDRYLTGVINRISPEAPVPVVHIQSEENRLGGAANVALNIKALGANPILLSLIGNDDNGTIFKNLLPQNDLTNEGIITSSHRQTTTKTRVLAGHQHVLRADREDTFDLNDDEFKTLEKRFISIIEKNKIDVILLQDYNKGVLTEIFIKRIIELAEKKGIPTAVDPKKKNFWVYKNVTLFKPNLKEIREGLSWNITPQLADLQKAGKEIRARMKNTYSLITLSEHGVYYDQANEQAIIPTHPRQIRDVCGAGDTVISVAACGLGLGLSLNEIAKLSNLAGGQVCEKVGVVPVIKVQLLEEYKKA